MRRFGCLDKEPKWWTRLQDDDLAPITCTAQHVGSDTADRTIARQKRLRVVKPTLPILAEAGQQDLALIAVEIAIHRLDTGTSQRTASTDRYRAK